MTESSEEAEIKKSVLVEVFWACGSEVLSDLENSSLDGTLVDRVYQEYEQEFAEQKDAFG